MFPIIWNFGPELMKIGNISVLYYSLLFAGSFVLARFIVLYIFKKENQNIELVDKLLIYMMLSTTLGARLGHVIFYEWDYYSKNLLEILLPFSFSESGMKFTGFRGLASHGSTIGILTGLLLFVFNNRKYFSNIPFKKKFGVDFLYIADRVCIGVALAGCMIRIGNFFNSEIEGTPVSSNFGVVFARTFAKEIEAHKIVEKVSFRKDNQARTGNLQPIIMSIKFNEKLRDKKIMQNFVKTELTEKFNNNYSANKHIKFHHEDNIPFEIKKIDRNYSVEVPLIGVVRHPAQLYESFGCLILLIILLNIWNKRKLNLRPGILISTFLIFIFGMRLFYESIKYGAIAFSNQYFQLNTAQVLSIPAILLGLFILLYSLTSIRREKV